MSTRSLGILLAIQAVFVVYAWLPGSSGADEARALVSFERDAITRVRVLRNTAEGETAEPVELARASEAEDGASPGEGGESWQIVSAGGYPADRAKVDALLDKLVGLRVRSPIATRATSHDALKVGEDDWGRKIEFEAGDESVALVIGAAARSGIYLRRSDEDTVYLASGVSEWSLSDRAASYYDAEYVAVDPEQLSGFTVGNSHGTLAFMRQDGAWRLEGAPAGQRVAQEEVDALVKAGASVRIAKPVGRERLDEYGLTSGVVVAWSIDGEQATEGGGYRIGAELDDLVYVKADDSPFVIQASAAGLARLREAKRADFLEAAPAEVVEPPTPETPPVPSDAQPGAGAS